MIERAIEPDGVKRYYAHDNILGALLIDTQKKELQFFEFNSHWKLRSLETPNCQAITPEYIRKMITRLRRANSRDDRDPSVYTYIYFYLLTEEEKARCTRKKHSYSGGKLICETNSYAHAVRCIAEWAIDEYIRGKPNLDASRINNIRESLLHDYSDFLARLEAEEEKAVEIR